MRIISRWFFLVTVTLATVSIATVAKADPKSFYFEKYQSRLNVVDFLSDDKSESRLLKNPYDPRHQKTSRKSFDGMAEESYYTQKLDHFDEDDSRTFKQRYFDDAQFAKGAWAPILLYVCGESSCSQSKLNGQIKEQARKIGARLVTLEHRYYGKSQPFEDLSTENLKFLSTDQALKDLAAFQAWYSKTKKASGRWAVVGGSYAGNLSAFYKVMNPLRVVGALASSAPVMAKESFEEYDAHVRKVAGEKCSEDMLLVFSQIEEAFDDRDELERIKKRFDAADIEQDLNFLYAVVDVSAAAVQYGTKDKFCQSIAGDDKLEGYIDFSKDLIKSWGIRLFNFSFESAISTKPPAEGKFGMRAWLYQSCTEYGYWQVANSDPSMSARSPLIDLTFHRKACKQLFDLDEPAPVEEFNKNHYEKLLSESASRIFYTNGDTDPWSTLSIVDQGLITAKGSNVYVIEGAAHCDDLRSSRSQDSKNLKVSRGIFANMLSSWFD